MSRKANLGSNDAFKAIEKRLARFEYQELDFRSYSVDCKKEQEETPSAERLTSFS